MLQWKPSPATSNTLNYFSSHLKYLTGHSTTIIGPTRMDLSRHQYVHLEVCSHKFSGNMLTISRGILKNQDTCSQYFRGLLVVSRVMLMVSTCMLASRCILTVFRGEVIVSRGMFTVSSGVVTVPCAVADVGLLGGGIWSDGARSVPQNFWGCRAHIRYKPHPLGGKSQSTARSIR